MQQKMVLYRGIKYFLVSIYGGGLIEIAPTQHGAGSFMVHEDFIQYIEQE